MGKGGFIALTFAVTAVVLFGLACGDDEQSPEEAKAKACDDVSEVQAAFTSFQNSLNANGTVGQVRETGEKFQESVQSLRESAGDAVKAQVDDLENAYDDLDESVKDIPDDATVKEALPTVNQAQQPVATAWQSLLTGLNCK